MVWITYNPYSLDETLGKTDARFLNTVFTTGNLVPPKWWQKWYT